MKTWYAARVMTGKEYDIKKEIKKINSDCDVYIPRRLVTEYKDGKLHQRTEAMLPGYLLIAPPEGSQKPLNTFLREDFLEIIGRVTPEELESLKTQEIDENGIIEIGKRIIVVDGPFAGCKGKILGRDIENKSAKCKLFFQGMELDMDMREDYINTIR